MFTQDNPEVRQALEEAPSEARAATTDLMTSFAQPLSRRWLLRGAMAGATGASALTALAAEAKPAGTILIEFFSILATGEELFVTFYSNAIKNHVQLGLYGDELNALKAIRAEEQLHLNLALAQGGVPATSQFSMPHGHETFEDRSLFLQTQQLGEELTSGALLAWIKDTAAMGLPVHAELGGQLMQVEGGHRVMGRVIMGEDPFPNWGFAPVVLDHFTDVPAAVKAAGFLTPGPGNMFDFHAVSPSFKGVINTTTGTI
ncbi:MAG: hypothetical protein ACREDM_12250 [Methylocella sp.]